MKRIIQTLLFVGIIAILPQFAFSQAKPEAAIEALLQGRVWTNKDGKKVTARAVAKTQDKVTLRMTDGKRVQISLDQLSKEDSEWLSNWEQPVIKVSVRVLDSFNKKGLEHPIPVPLQQRVFMIENYPTYLFLLENESREFLAAFKEFFELASKPLTDVKSYKKVIYQRKPNGKLPARDILEFSVYNGKPYLNGTITPKQVLQYQDFLETFSVREWDKQQEEIKRRFE